MAGRRGRAVRSAGTTAGTMPVQATAARSPARVPSTRGIRAQTLRHHWAGSASAQPGRDEDRSTGALACASTAPSGSARTTLVLVEPTSMPRTRDCMSGLPGRVDEPLGPVRVDRVPGVAVHLQRAADDAAVRELQ